MDERQFEELYVTHFQDVARAVYALAGSREEAVDVAQEAFALTWQHWSESGGRTDPYPYTLRIATNLAISQLRRIITLRRILATRRRHALQPADDLVALRVDLIRALRELPRRQRAVVVLCDLIEVPPAEAARILRMSVSTLRVHRSRAYAKLRDLITNIEQEPDSLEGLMTQDQQAGRRTNGQA